MSNEEEKKCPLCAEEMDWTDQQLNPCKCGYEVCVWCWHHIMDMAEKDATEGRCPACRTPYDKDRIVGLETNFQRVVGNGSSRKQKLQKSKSKSSEGRKDLSSVRVMQRRMAYIIGLPLDLADEELLKRKDYFGQYGKVTKVSLSRTAGGTIQQFINDTCSVYITFSKEEEAVTCIQSVHGYVLDGRLLRASFGTAKYCHAWLRNTPCNNPSCLYLHNMGAEEDSFGKDEAAAVHTSDCKFKRYLTEDWQNSATFRNRVQEIVGATHYVNRRFGSMLPPPVVEQFNDDSASSEEPVCNDGQKDVASGDQLPLRSSKQMTTFVDIVGRSSSSSSNKDVSSVEEERILSAWSDSNQVETESSDSVVLKSSTPNQLVNSPTSDDQISKDYVESSQTSSFIPSDHAITTKHSGVESWWHTEYDNQISHVDKEDNIPALVVNSELNDGYNEKKFQNSAKSDRIYRGSNSFSNEEIVEHLRRIDHDDALVDNDENSAAVESSIISNILSMDLDGSDDPVYHPQTVARNGRIDSASWNFQNNDHSRFSFAKEHTFSNQQNDLISPRNIGQGLPFSIQDSCENKDVVYKPQHQASRAQNLKPPGFSAAPCKPPPGFSACLMTEQAIAAGPGNYVKVGTHALHYRSPSSGNLSNSSDDLFDLISGNKSSTNSVLTNSWPSSISSRCSSSFVDDSKNWLFMQQQQSGPQFSQATMQQQHTTPQFPSSRDDFFGGLTSGVNLRNQSYTSSLFTQQPNFAGGFQQHNNLQETQQVGFNSFLPGYGDYMFQMPTTGDVYTRVFGM